MKTANSRDVRSFNIPVGYVQPSRPHGGAARPGGVEAQLYRETLKVDLDRHGAGFFSFDRLSLTSEVAPAAAGHKHRTDTCSGGTSSAYRRPRRSTYARPAGCSFKARGTVTSEPNAVVGRLQLTAASCGVQKRQPAKWVQRSRSPATTRFQTHLGILNRFGAGRNETRIRSPT